MITKIKQNFIYILLLFIIFLMSLHIYTGYRMYKQDARNYVVHFSASIDMIVYNLDDLILWDGENMESFAIALENNLNKFESTFLDSPSPRYNILRNKYYFADRLHGISEFSTMNFHLRDMCKKIKEGEALSESNINYLNSYHEALKELQLNLRGGVVPIEKVYEKKQFNEFLKIFEADLKSY